MGRVRRHGILRGKGNKWMLAPAVQAGASYGEAHTICGHCAAHGQQRQAQLLDLRKAADRKNSAAMDAAPKKTNHTKPWLTPTPAQPMQKQ